MSKDYSQGIIYKITSKNTGRCYIGSTVQKLSMRMGGHRRDYKKYKKGSKKYCSSYIVFEDGNIEYECIAKNPCENSKQLRKAEGFYQKKYECVNIRIEGRTKKEYCEDNKQKISKHRKEYRLENKQKIKEYYQENKQKIKEYYQENKEKIKEYYQENKEKILKQKKEYDLKNKEKNSKRQNEKNICLCCGGRYTKQNWAVHAKAKKHVKAQSIQEELQSLIPLYHQDSHFS